MEIIYGDTGWAELYTLWQADGAAATFERIEDNACQRWAVMQQPGDTYPRFLLASAQAGTETGNDRPVEWQPRRGYGIENRAAGMRFRSSRKGIRISKRMPPRDASTVTLE